MGRRRREDSIKVDLKTEHTGIISRLVRLTWSDNGNPRFLVQFEDGFEARTMVDSSIGYLIENHEYRENVVTVQLNPARRIIGIVAVYEDLPRNRGWSHDQVDSAGH